MLLLENAQNTINSVCDGLVVGALVGTNAEPSILATHSLVRLFQRQDLSVRLSHQIGTDRDATFQKTKLLLKKSNCYFSKNQIAPEKSKRTDSSYRFLPFCNRHSPSLLCFHQSLHRDP